MNHNTDSNTNFNFKQPSEQLVQYFANQKISQVIGIGNAIVDLTIRVDDADFIKLTNSGVALQRGAMTLVDYQQLTKILAIKPIIYSTAGGSVANSLKITASTGINSAFIGSVANDDFGTKFSNALANLGCFFYNYHHKEDLKNNSAVCAVLVDEQGERTMATYLGCAGKLASQAINLTNEDGKKLFYLEGYLWDNETTIATVNQWLNNIKQKQDLVAFSLSDAFCVKRKQQDFFNIITKNADIIFANHLEISALLDLTFFDLLAIDKFCSQYPNKLFAITCGGDGAYIFYRCQFFHSPAIEDVAIVDLTGAGDAFAGGLIYGLAQGKDLLNSVKIAQIFASKIISRFGSELDLATIKSIILSIS